MNLPMNKRRRFLRSAAMLSSVAAALSMSVACSSSSSGGSTSTTEDASTHHDSGSATKVDSGTSTLYTRLGGHAGIRSAVNAIVGKELANADIASYFFFQAGAPANGHPTADQIEECFTNFVGGAAGGPEAYPTTVVDEAGSFTCQDMKTAHAALKINSGTFDEFVMIAGAELTALGVSSADITTLAGALESTAPDIVTEGDGGLQTYPGDGGT